MQRRDQGYTNGGCFIQIFLPLAWFDDVFGDGMGRPSFFAPNQTHHFMRTKNLAVLPRTAALSGQGERIRTLVINQLRRVLHRYHLRVCAITGMRMSQATAVRAGLAMLCGALTLITAECLPLCMLFLSLTLLIAQPWKK